MAMTAQVERAGALRTAAVSRIGKLPTTVTRYEDPLDADRADDVAVSATRRSLCRVALIASEAGARFQRESAACDPMAWMLAPRKLFGGGAAIEACLDRDHFSRALLLHGLGLGVDANPEDIDGLLSVRSGADSGADGADAAEGGGTRMPGLDPGSGSVPPFQRPDPAGAEPGSEDAADDASLGVFVTSDRRRLYSATIVFSSQGVDIVAFHASFAHGYDEVFERLFDRFGGEVTSAAEVRRGFDPGHPLLPKAVAKLLSDAEGWPDDGRTMSLDVNFERCIKV